jgi:hypothetical protein
MRDIGIRFHSCYKFLEWKRFRNLLKNPISVLCPTVRFHSFLKYILSLLLHCKKLKLSKFIIFFFSVIVVYLNLNAFMTVIYHNEKKNPRYRMLCQKLQIIVIKQNFFFCYTVNYDTQAFTTKKNHCEISIINLLTYSLT